MQSTKHAGHPICGRLPTALCRRALSRVERSRMTWSTGGMHGRMVHPSGRQQPPKAAEISWRLPYQLSLPTLPGYSSLPFSTQENFGIRGFYRHLHMQGVLQVNSQTQSAVDPRAFCCEIRNIVKCSKDVATSCFSVFPTHPKLYTVNRLGSNISPDLRTNIS